ncbi:MAG: bifunctional indole-3-glycerol-phosphate synthase TrpC/phosphoribosylanthranilate isomerase TrpF [Candidatus Xenobia bacterium]
MVLDGILAQKREDVARREHERPLATLDPAPSDRSFEAALRAPQTALILECKQASPSAGLLRDGFDPTSIADVYAPFASAISVLTDQPFFRGSFEHLRRVRERVSCPVLCKDFVLGPYQVVEARGHGADAVLLMLSVLDDATWRVCAEVAQRLNVDVLTEVHSEDELSRAIDLGARIIGINNRDLKTLKVDLEVTRRLAPRAPADRVVISESGIASHRDVRNLRGMVDGFLVGSALMRAESLPHAVRELVFGRVKVCGLMRATDARQAWEMGATYGGLIFASESPRRVTVPENVQVVPLRWVGVFVNATLDELASAALTSGRNLRARNLHALQLHGEEPPEFVRAMRVPCEVWKAHRVQDALPRVEQTGATRIVLDGFHRDKRGGSGVSFDWSLLDGYPDRERVVLGGGLTPEKAAAADALDVWALDVNSGVEDAPGQKNAERMRAFMQALRGRRRQA